MKHSTIIPQEFTLESKVLYQDQMPWSLQFDMVTAQPNLTRSIWVHWVMYFCSSLVWSQVKTAFYSYL